MLTPKGLPGLRLDLSEVLQCLRPMPRYCPEPDWGPFQKATALRRTVSAAIQAADPGRLLAMGCPDDEYNPEVDDVVGRLLQGEPLSRQLIQQVFTKWFSPELPCSTEDADEIVRNIQNPLPPGAFDTVT